MTTMVFHAPYPVVENGTGSAARPPRLLRAFRELGIEVLDVTGHGAERARKLRALRRRLRAGQRIDFAYGESSTMPTVLTEPHHLPTHPLVDLELLRLLRAHGVPTGLFYRDVYWRFPAYDLSVPRLVGLGTKTLYHAELQVMGRWLDRLYLPSAQMAAYVPHVDPAITRALPPGGVLTDLAAAHGRRPGEPLRIFYVGNVSDYYRMHALFAGAARVDGVELTVCVPPEAWEAVRSEYEPLIADGPGRVRVVHGRGAELEPYFAAADLCALVVEPAEYRDFAAPIKLFEYIGHGLPVLASAGTHAADLVTSEGMGWSVDYDADAVAARLVALRDDPAEVERVRDAVRRGREHHSWEARARQVAEDLSALR